MKRYFISPQQRQYRANLHSHSTASDGHLSPEALKALYRARGYSILAITDHELPRSYSHMNESDFLLLTGYEAFIRPNPDYAFDPYEPEVHLNLFAKDPSNETVICYNRASNKFFDKNGIDPEKLRRAGSERAREYSVPYVNEFIRTAVKNGYLVAYNHPVWSLEDEETILSYENIFSLEIDNYCSYQGNGLEHSGALYDKLLRRRKRVFCHGGDDNHNANAIESAASDSCGAWTMILAEDLTYSAVIDAMESGRMYSSTGPLLKEISVEDGAVHVECSPVAKIVVFMGNKTPRALTAERGSTLTYADLRLDPVAPYFRVSVIDSEGRRASSRGFFRDEYQ